VPNLLERLRRLMPSQETLQRNRWLRWAGPALLHPRLWHVSRRGVAMGAAIGVFFAFITPIAQIPLSVAVSMVLRANVPVSVVATLVNTPPTFPAVYWAAWKLGSAILGHDTEGREAPPIPGVDAPLPTARAESPDDPRSWWQRGLDGMASVGPPLLLGSAIFSVVGAALTWLGVNGIWHLRVRRKRRRRLLARRLR
jgi:uncharacterized protein (DUF2062 family)